LDVQKVFQCKSPRASRVLMFCRRKLKKQEKESINKLLN
jgi:hypothetical protein